VSSNRRLMAGSLILLLLLALVIVWMAGGFNARVLPGLLITEARTGGSSYVVSSQKRPSFERVPGSIEARETTLVSSRVLSTVERVLVRAGDRVEADDLLVSLDQRDLKARLESLTASRAAIDARLQEAQKTLVRTEELLERGLLSQADADKAVAAEAALLAERQAVSETAKELAAAVSYTEVRAPIAGRVVDRFVEPGDLASPGARLVSLYNPGSLEVAVKVRESLAMRLALGDAVQVTVPSVQRSFSAQVSEIVPVADRVSRSFDVTLQVSEIQGLLPGLFAEAQIPSGEELWRAVPEEFVQHLGQLNLVWIESPSGPVKRFVRVGRSEGGYLEITAGLEDGDRLIEQP